MKAESSQQILQLQGQEKEADKEKCAELVDLQTNHQIVHVIDLCKKSPLMFPTVRYHVIGL